METGLTVGRLKSLLSYEPLTGEFHWLVKRGNRAAGALAYSVDGKGYLRVRIDGVDHRAHRLAWLYVHGVWPADQIDHSDTDRKNNKLSNLREADNSLNNANRDAASNNTSGIKGVRFDSGRKKWRAEIKKNGQVKHLGRFENKTDAAAAYALAATRYFGEFSRVEV